ncbi:MAG: hypothetical protein MMC33_006027, partial [Icmadophila ericetorum]|nr:hypothetical protein [Icmadophila ericetorum]
MDFPTPIEEESPSPRTIAATSLIPTYQAIRGPSKSQTWEGPSSRRPTLPTD